MEADRSEFTVCMNRKWRGGDHRMKKIFNAGLGLLVATCMALPAYAQDDEDGRDERDPVEANDNDEVIDEIISTGTRLGGGDLSSRVETISAEEIKVRGLATLEDVIRSIPQNYSTVNSGTNLNTFRDQSDVQLGTLGLGVSTANLRGLGSASTLILVNGRRLAGSAGQEDFFVNLREIPASAIERVEVLLDGGSQIYGADAIGGVINIVLRKNYTGLQLTGRYENSSTDGDLERVNTYLGYAWSSGNISATASLTKMDPISNAKTGFVTRDHRPLFNSDDAGLDARRTIPRSGLIVFLNDPLPRPEFILPIGNDGRNIAGRGDLVAFDPETDRLDPIGRDATGGTEDLAVTVNFEQSLFDDRFVFRSELLQTRSETVRQFDASPLQGFFEVPESNAFNNFGERTFVRYFPATEFANGLIPTPQNQKAVNKHIRYFAGFDLNFTDKLQWTVEYMHSQSRSVNDQVSFRGSVNSAITDDPELQARLDELLSSSDPNVAVNFFGDGSGQNPGIADFVLRSLSRSGNTVTSQYTTYIKGNLFNLPAGPVSYVLGGEWRDNELREAPVIVDQIGIDPITDTGAAFAELYIPLYSDKNAVPGIHSLSLTLQARRDKSESMGAVGSESGPPFPPPPIIEEVDYSHTTPRFGFAWEPTENFLWRGSYSEGFRAPTFRDLFNTSSFSFMTPFVFDPLTGSFVFATLSVGPNPDLQPETSENISTGVTYNPRWAPGLQMSLDYSNVEFDNRIAGAFELLNLLPPEVYGSQPDFFVRDDDGNLLEFVSRPVNISRTVSETLDADISYRFESGWGAFEPGLNVSYVLDQFDQAAPGGEEVSFRGKTIGVDRYHLRARLGWERNNWSGAVFVDHTPSYRNESIFVPEVAQLDIDSRTTVDLSVAYRREDMGLTVRGGARNLFDEDFPFGFFGGGVPYDAKRVDLRGRVIFLEATLDLSDVIGRN